MLPISALAILIGALCAFVALFLLRLIGLFTNLFYFGRWSTALVSPAGNHLGLFSVLVLPAASSIQEFRQAIRRDHKQSQRLLPVVDNKGVLVGVLTRNDLRERMEQEGEALWRRTWAEVARTEIVEAFPDEPLRMVVYRMAEKGITRVPVVERNTRKFLGLVSLDDLLKARARHLEEERRREQVLNLRFFLPGAKMPDQTQTPAAS